MDADKRADRALMPAEVAEFCRLLATVLRRGLQQESVMDKDNRLVDGSDREHELNHGEKNPEEVNDG